jgi:hypothetical protein
MFWTLTAVLGWSGFLGATICLACEPLDRGRHGAGRPARPRRRMSAVPRFGVQRPSAQLASVQMETALTTI